MSLILGGTVNLYGRASEHNLQRALGQWAFARSVGEQRDMRLKKSSSV